MKKHFASLIIAATLFSCSHSSSPKFYGEAFDTTQVISVGELALQSGVQKEVTVKGIISSSCQGDGCWLNLANPGGKEIYVDWDEKFHLPHDISGKTVFIRGHAYVDTTAEGNPLAFKASGVHL
jgi:hypothetical protein